MRIRSKINGLDHYPTALEAKLGSLPIGALEDKRVRGDFKAFRDSFSDTPRKADCVWTTMASLRSPGLLRERMLHAAGNEPAAAATHSHPATP